MDYEPNEQSAGGTKRFFASTGGKWVIIGISMLVIYGLMFLGVEFHWTWATIAIAAFTGYFGWQVLARMNLNFILVLPIVGWIIFYAIKGALALIIGWFVAPFCIAKKIGNAVHEQFNA